MSPDCSHGTWVVYIEWRCGDRQTDTWRYSIVFCVRRYFLRVGSALFSCLSGEECSLRDGQNATQKPLNRLNWVPRMQCGVSTACLSSPQLFLNLFSSPRDGRILTHYKPTIDLISQKHPSRKKLMSNSLTSWISWCLETRHTLGNDAKVCTSG